MLSLSFPKHAPNIQKKKNYQNLSNELIAADIDDIHKNEYTWWKIWKVDPGT